MRTNFTMCRWSLRLDPNERVAVRTDEKNSQECNDRPLEAKRQNFHYAALTHAQYFHSHSTAA